MAVQQNRKTRSKRGMRRSHDGLKAKALSIEPTTGELLLAAPTFPLHPGADGEKPCGAPGCKAPGESGISVEVASEDGVADGNEKPVRDNPFAVLARLKKEH